MRVSSARLRHGAAGALVTTALFAAACGGDDEPAETGALGSTVSTTTLAKEPPPIRERGDLAKDGDRPPGHAGEGGGATAPSGPDAQAAERALVRKGQAIYRRYLAALNARDGAVLCRLLAPGFEDELELPEGGSSCPARLGRSIGYEDPRGSPVWKATELDTLESAIVDDAGRVQLSVAIVTRFADRDEASLESDIAFLEPARRGAYVLAKAPGSLWRAVGKPDVPPSVITPPPGF